MKKSKIILYAAGFALLVPAFITSLPIAVRIVCAGLVYLYFGFDVFKDMIEEFKEGEIFNEGFLMCFATIGAIVLGEYADAAAVMILFSLGESLGDLAYDRSMDSLEELIDLTPEYAYVLSDGEKIKVLPEELIIGSTVLVSAGERIPADGTVIEGTASADYSSITGEPEPVSLSAGDSIVSGGIISGGSVCFTVESEYEDSTAARMKAAMKEAAEKKAPHEKFITRFAEIYTPAAIALAVMIAAVGILTGKPVYDSVKAGLIIMVISCPCALVLSVPLTYCAAMGKANKLGFIFKGGEAVERAADVGAVVFDKTGTLTEGTPGVKAVEPRGVSESRFRDIAYALMKNSLHPLSQRFCETADPGEYLISENAEEIPGKGVRADIDGAKALAGSARFLAENGIVADPAGTTAVHVAYDGSYIGRILFEDALKPGAKDIVTQLGALGVRRTAILSGDASDSVEKVANELGISEYRAGLLPDEKLSAFEEISAECKKADKNAAVAYCGDGLNDSAVIKRSDAGIAMGGGSDRSGIAASVEAADVVIGDSDVGKLPLVIRTARKTMRKVKQNIVFSLAVKAAIMLVSIFLYRNMELAVAADVGVMLICIFNAISI